MTERQDYRRFPGNWYLPGPDVIKVLLLADMAEKSHVLDIGCGPLRIGRLLIPFLLPGHYYGLDPEKDLVEEALARELIADYGEQFVRYKEPAFAYDAHFNLSRFGDAQFNVAFANQVFCHCGNKQLGECLESLAPVLAPGGRFLLNIHMAEEDQEVNKSPESGGDNYRFASHRHTFYSPSSFMSLVEKHGYTATNVGSNWWKLLLTEEDK